MASRGLRPSLRCASSAKSIIMIAFFLTMPISRMMPITATMPRSVPNSISARGEVERDRGGGKLPDMRDGQCGGLLDQGRDGRQRHLRATCRGQVNVAQRLRAALKFRPHFQHHAILVGLREDGGNDALAKGA